MNYWVKIRLSTIFSYPNIDNHSMINYRIHNVQCKNRKISDFLYFERIYTTHPLPPSTNARDCTQVMSPGQDSSRQNARISLYRVPTTCLPVYNIYQKN